MLTLDKSRWRVHRYAFQLSHKFRLFQNKKGENKTSNPYLSNSETVKPFIRKVNKVQGKFHENDSIKHA